MKYVAEYKGSPFTVLEFEEMINLFERENADAEDLVKSYKVILNNTMNAIIRRDPEAAEKTYEYWKKLRTNLGGKKGLLRKYWKPPDPMNVDPKVTFRRSTEEKRNLRRYRKYNEEYLKKVYYRIF